MKYYRLGKEVMAFESDGSQDEWIPVEAIKMTSGEVEAHLNPPVSLRDAKRAKILEINKEFEQASNKLIKDYPEVERLTWPMQSKEALAWQDNPLSPTPFLDGIAEERGIDREIMVALTLENTTAFSEASQMFIGKRQRLRDAVGEATTNEEVDLITWDEED